MSIALNVYINLRSTIYLRRYRITMLNSDTCSSYRNLKFYTSDFMLEGSKLNNYFLIATLHLQKLNNYSLYNRSHTERDTLIHTHTFSKFRIITKGLQFQLLKLFMITYQHFQYSTSLDAFQNVRFQKWRLSRNRFRLSENQHAVQQ